MVLSYQCGMVEISFAVVSNLSAQNYLGQINIKTKSQLKKPPKLYSPLKQIHIVTKKWFTCHSRYKLPYNQYYLQGWLTISDLFLNSILTLTFRFGVRLPSLSLNSWAYGVALSSSSRCSNQKFNNNIVRTICKP